MGIHDDIKIEYELPVPNLPQDGWQTKSLDCNMSSYILTKEGRLLERVQAIELWDGVVHDTGKWKTIDRNLEGVFRVYQMINEIWYQFEIVMIDGDVKQVKDESRRPTHQQGETGSND